MNDNKAYSIFGIPILKRDWKIWSISFGVWNIVTCSILVYLGFFQLYAELLFSELDTLDESEILIIRFIFFTMVGHAGHILWLIGHMECSRLAKMLFAIQRIEFFHLVWSKKIVPISDVVLLKNQTKWYESILVMFTGLWSISLIINHFIHPYMLLPNSTDTGWLFLTDTALVSSFAYLIMVPITILYSSNIRIKIKRKNTIVTGYSLYQKLIISFAAFTVLYNILSDLQFPSSLTLLDYGFFAMPIILTCMYAAFTNKILSEKFRIMLKKCGAAENDSKAKPL